MRMRNVFNDKFFDGNTQNTENHIKLHFVMKKNRQLSTERQTDRHTKRGIFGVRIVTMGGRYERVCVCKAGRNQE